MPKYIQLSTGKVNRLRRKPTILRIHDSSKKARDEVFYAELQLLSNWRNEDIAHLRQKVSNILDVFNKKPDRVLKVRSKIYPFSIKELIEEVKAQEILNQLPDDMKNRLDSEGEKNDADDLMEDLREFDHPATDFESWVDDPNNVDYNNKSNETKYRCLQLDFKDELLSVTCA